MNYDKKDRLIFICRIVVKVLFVASIIGTIFIAYNAAHHGETLAHNSFGYYTKEAYTDTETLFIYLGCGAVISIAELLIGLLTCDFLDNTNYMAHQIEKIAEDRSRLDYYNRESKQIAKAVVNELTTNMNVVELFGTKKKEESTVEEKQEDIKENTAAINKNHAPVVPIKGDKDKIVCPLCKTEQRSNRNLCMNCAVPFITEK